MTAVLGPKEGKNKQQREEEDERERLKDIVMVAEESMGR